MSSSALKLLAASGAKGDPVYVDDVFSTTLYKGDASTQTVTTGIDVLGEGGLIWTCQRTNGGGYNLIDSGQGSSYSLDTTSANPPANNSTQLTFLNDGYRINGGSTAWDLNQNNLDYVAWSWQKQPGFFDVVTYTGNGSSQNISHNLGTTPGFIAIKCTSHSSTNWSCWHRSIPTSYVLLNSSQAAQSAGSRTVNGSTFQINGLWNDEGANGRTYVAYLFAHDAQDFGTDSDESIIKCGGYNGSSSGESVTVDLGWEPEFILIKNTVQTSDWYLIDTMRGMPVTGVSRTLKANTTNAEGDFSNGVIPTATGFTVTYGGGYAFNHSSSSYIYMAIRRPFKPAEEFAATDLFNPTAVTQDGKPSAVTNFPVDLGILRNYGSNEVVYLTDRLRGPARLNTATNGAEVSGSAAFVFDYNNGYLETTWDTSSYSSWSWRRAPGFFDVVAYKGTGSAKTVTHNLGVAPEMIWVKARDRVAGWHVYAEPIGNNYKLTLDEDSARGVDSNWNNTTPNNSTFSIGTESVVNTNNKNYIAHLFATVAGISKVGSYTGTGNDLNVACGFSAGARFVMIKRSDATGDWYVWDTYRGIAAGNDPYLLMNDTAAQVTNTDYIDPLASGFTVTSSAPAALNASGGSYIFYAIA